jgi:hypothetical protein
MRDCVETPRFRSLPRLVRCGRDMSLTAAGGAKRLTRPAAVCLRQRAEEPGRGNEPLTIIGQIDGARIIRTRSDGVASSIFATPPKP